MLNLVEEQSPSINNDEPSRTDPYYKSSTFEGFVNDGVTEPPEPISDVPPWYQRFYCEVIPDVSVMQFCCT